MKRPPLSLGPAPLSRRTLRIVERVIGVYLDAPVSPSRSPNQQFGVYDEDEAYVGDITASTKLFDLGALIGAVADLFGKGAGAPEWHNQVEDAIARKGR